MHEVNRSAIVPHNADSMFDLITDVESYAEFLPWCTAGKIISGPSEQDGDTEVVARLGMSQGPMTGQFTTRNRMRRPHRVVMTLVDGPFSELEGLWELTSLGDGGCKLELTMRFAFSNPVKDLLLGAAFASSCSQLVDAFVARAGSVYG
jgi:ribosome-associated toxin RatA of RatAB toxin-antitoxin module